MPFTGNKSAGANFGTFTCRFYISTALSELNVPLWILLGKTDLKSKIIFSGF